GVRIAEGSSGIDVGGVADGAGNVISGNASGGVEIVGSSGNEVMGNYVGTDASGASAIPNDTGGIRVDASEGNLIGGTTAGAGNVVSGNTGTGILLIDALSGGNTVQGNLVGLTATGDALLGNTGFFPAGIDVLRSPNSRIGGTTTGAGNVVAGHGGYGIEVATFSEGTVVQGNYVGTDVTGTVALGGNTFGGIDLFNVCAVQVGGTSAAARNVASGNDGPGISITGSASDDCATPSQIEGNYVGVAADGTTPLGNGASGIVIERITNNRVGGTTAGAPNRIAHNDGAGILITSSAFSGPPASRIALVRNETFSNAGRGIDLSADATAPDGLTPNDDGDGDSGPNNLQNFPEITSAAYDDDSGTVEVTYLVPTDPVHAAYPLTIDFYRADASGEEGQTWLGSDPYTAADYTNGPAKTITFNPAVAVTATDFIVATATDDDGNTSEFTGGSTQLPVELTAFDAVVDGETVLLRWSTASETNNAGFEVQVRDAQSATNETDDEDAHEDAWQALGFVAGHGTTAEAQHYTYRAPDLAPGTHRFRLKQIDFDGAFEYAPEVEVTIGLDAAYRFTAPYPNPARNEARLSLMVQRAQPVVVHVYDLLGRRVRTLFQGEVAAHQARALVLRRGDLPSGLYVVRAEGERFTATRTVTLLR
ncbi:MAG: T9SS type A sorting domain-containing protein, partial [Bacteroidetes bacterium]|nr:T9SS type A sorting domain-containing protein [Bacteroidota bacterium]